MLQEVRACADVVPMRTFTRAYPSKRRGRRSDGQAGPGAGGARVPPATADPLATMRRIAIAMFVIGGLTCLSGVWTTEATHASKASQALVAGAFVATGIGLWAVRAPRRWLLEASVLWSIALLGALIARSDPLGMAPLFYLWPVVLLAYFSSIRMLATAYAWAGVTLATGLAVNGHLTLRMDTFTGTLSAVGLMGALVAAMTRREGQLRRELALAAQTDPLTGLLNRRSFTPRLEALVDDAAEGRRPLSVVMFDLDHFKQLNDEFGHLAGDRVLELFADVLEAQARREDLVSRLGGEEFAVALPNSDPDDARSFAARVAGALRQSATSDHLTVTTSAGISWLTTDDASAETLLGRADAALYAAKEGGRCRQAWWDGGAVLGPRFGEPSPV